MIDGNGNRSYPIHFPLFSKQSIMLQPRFVCVCRLGRIGKQVGAHREATLIVDGANQGKVMSIEK